MNDESASREQPESGYLLDRRLAVPALLGDHRDFLIVTGLAGTAKDIAHLSDDGAHVFTMAGAMGAAVSIGLGLALAKPDRRVLVVTGDGELLMNLGALATVAVMRPPNLAVVCVDNGHYGETGGQRSHTSLGVNLEAMAAAAGMPATRTISKEDEIPAASRLLRESNGPAFVVLRVRPGDPPAYKRNMDAAACRVRFRAALLGP
ncbi:MAG TPA: thiamine pyrophosphate-dependent enzyme [Gammaproteobacteria bacterium]|nr:thiamine pyrophosphate-dependent enzyme [Gammaproteobacteria bacterium]